MMFDLDRIADAYPADCRPIGARAVLGNAGGFSGSLLIRFDSGRGELLARGWPIGFAIEEVLRIHSLLRRLEPLGFIPTPLTSRLGATAVFEQGRAWELSSWLASDRQGAEGDPGFSVLAFAALAAVHQRAAPVGLRGPSPGLAARKTETDDLLQDGLRTLRSVAEAERGVLAETSRRWLDGVPGKLPELQRRLAKAVGVSVPLQPCLRDPRPEHFLFRDGRLAGLVDFGAVGIESVAGDLARLSLLWFDGDRRAAAAALAAYEQIRPLSREERWLMSEFEYSGAILGPARWIRWLLIERIAFPDPVEATRRFVRSVERYERVAGAITSGF